MTPAEGERRGEEETIKVVDEELAKRGIKILNAGIVVQNIPLSKKAKDLDMLDLSNNVGYRRLERVTITMSDTTSALVAGDEFRRDLTALRWKL